MVNGQGERDQTNKRVLATCILVFILSAGLRFLESPSWDRPALKVDGEWLLTTNDAYFWVAGAEGSNPVATPMPMSQTLVLLSAVLPISPANLAYGFSALLPALVSIPIALWAFYLGAPLAAVIAPILATLAPAFYHRTRLGFFDTDWATLFFPLLISWLLAVWIQPHLKHRDPGNGIQAGDRYRRVIPAGLIFLTLFSLPWHNSIGLNFIAVLGLSAILAVMRGLSKERSRVIQTLIALALTVAAGWLGAALALLILWVRERYPAIFNHRIAYRLSLILLLILLVSIVVIEFQSYILNVLQSYLGEIFGELEAALVFPAFAPSVRETQVVNLNLTLEGMAFNSLFAILGLLGTMLVVRKKPGMLLQLPLLLLGLGAVRTGVRFTIFATPVMLLGLTVPVEWYAAKASEKISWLKNWKALLLFMAFMLVARQTLAYTRLPIETVLQQAHAAAIKDLAKVADPDGLIWTWWDYGYATQHFSGLKTFADGRRISGEYLHSLGFVLGSDQLGRSAEFMKFAASENFEPWRLWNTWKEDEIQAWLEERPAQLSTSSTSQPTQYLVVSWEGVAAIPWIQYYGSWDFTIYEGQRSRVWKILKPLRLDLETGVFGYDAEQEIRVVSVDRLGFEDPGYFDYPENAGGPHLLLNMQNGEVFLLDERAYRSAFVQLLIMPADQLKDSNHFQLLIDRYPSVRVFELR
jgi:dolichyl-diphosphooligosaccharide--protein glycosyltransferase